MDASGYDHAAFIPEFYDHIVPYATRADVRFYVEAARECGGPVLELGCGTGRILVPTARAGVEIAGLDASEGMLDACRRRLRAEPPEVQGRVSLHRGDLRDFDLARVPPGDHPVPPFSAPHHSGGAARLPGRDPSYSDFDRSPYGSRYPGDLILVARPTA
jgi:SAM-dependent methyltransferase